MQLYNNERWRSRNVCSDGRGSSHDLSWMLDRLHMISPWGAEGMEVLISYKLQNERMKEQNKKKKKE